MPSHTCKTCTCIFSGSFYIRNENHHNGKHIAAYYTTNITRYRRSTVANWWSIGLQIERFWIQAPFATPCCVLEQGTLRVLLIPRKRWLYDFIYRNNQVSVPRQILFKLAFTFGRTSLQPNNTCSICI